MFLGKLTMILVLFVYEPPEILSPSLMVIYGHMVNSFDFPKIVFKVSVSPIYSV